MSFKPLTPEQEEKRRGQYREMQKRAAAKYREKQADPEWRAEQRRKQNEARERQQKKAREKQQERFRAGTIAQQDAIDDYSNETRPVLEGELMPRLMEMAAINPKPPAQPQRRPSTRGLKGRTPLASEKRLADKLASLPCIACYRHGKISPLVSLHHMHGRTVLGAHEKQLPLCQYHHQVVAPAEMRRKFPWLIPFHAAGNCGGKSEWERRNGSQEDLYEQCLEMIADGFDPHILN